MLYLLSQSDHETLMFSDKVKIKLGSELRDGVEEKFLFQRPAQAITYLRPGSDAELFMSWT